MKRHLAIEAVIAPVVVGLGCEFIGLEYLSQGKNSILRLYIDSPGGVSIEQCSKISRQISSVLEVESQLVRGEYTLEVSSPGVDRKLFTLEQFPAFIGRKVRVALVAAQSGQRNFEGILIAVKDQQVSLEVNGSAINLDFADIAQANIVDDKARL